MKSARPSTEYGTWVCFISYQGLAVQIKFYSGTKVIYLGPVVQSIVSLTSSLRGQLVKC